MNCKQIVSFSVAYYTHQLDENTNAAIQKHLAHCRSCNSFYAYTQNSLNHIQLEKRTDNDPYFFAALKAKIENQKQENKSWITPMPALRFAMLTLVVVLSIFGGLLFGSYTAEVLNTTTINTQINTDNQLGFDMADNDIDLFKNL